MFGALVLIVNVKVIISAYEYTFWFLFTIFLSVGSFFLIFGLMSVWQFMTTTGQLQHTYNLLQTYLILTFFMFSYVLIDEGMMKANAEIRYFMDLRRDQIERQTRRKLQKDETLDKSRYNNLESKSAF